MSLINCPECGNECSTTAASCPHCGFTFVKQVAQPRVVVRQVERDDSFPKWVFIPLAILGGVILIVIFAMLRNSDTADQRNVNVNLTTARQPERTSTTTTTTTVPSTSQPSTVTVPATSQPSTVSVPQTVAPPPTTTTNVPSSSTSSTVTVPTDKSSVVMNAKILAKNGKPQSASKVKFYLLDKDLESILAEAKIEDELGQGLVNAFGLSVVEPNKYQEVNQKAYAAIKKHIVYSTTTDGTGKAQLQDVKSNNYYLFGVTSTKTGFAIWNAPVYINTGQNALNLEPIAITEVVSTEDDTTEF